MTLLGKANWWLPGWLDRALPGGRTGTIGTDPAENDGHASVSSADPGERGDEHHRHGSSFVGAHLSELRQCRSTQLSQMGAQLGDCSVVLHGHRLSRPAALSGSTSSAAHTSASRVAPNIWALPLT
jgi:hypothetical protein